MPILLSFFLLLWTAASPPESLSDWKLHKGTVTFQIRNAGLTVNGSLGGLQTHIRFDPAHPEQGAIAASVEAATIDTGIGARDNHLRKELYFHADKYPKLSLQSVRITSTGKNAYEGVFKLTIKATTREVKIPFSFSQQDQTGTFKGRFSLNRQDYGIGKSSWLLSDEVQVSVEATVSQ